MIDFIAIQYTFGMILLMGVFSAVLGFFIFRVFKKKRNIFWIMVSIIGGILFYLVLPLILILVGIGSLPIGGVL